MLNAALSVLQIGGNRLSCFGGAGWGAQIRSGRRRIPNTEMYEKHRKFGRKHAEKIKIWESWRMFPELSSKWSNFRQNKWELLETGSRVPVHVLSVLLNCANSPSPSFTYWHTKLPCSGHIEPHNVHVQEGRFFLWIRRMNTTPLANLPFASFSL